MTNSTLSVETLEQFRIRRYLGPGGHLHDIGNIFRQRQGLLRRGLMQSLLSSLQIFSRIFSLFLLATGTLSAESTCNLLLLLIHFLNPLIFLDDVLRLLRALLSRHNANRRRGEFE